MKYLLVILLQIACATTALGQSKFHVDVDYHYALGLNEHFGGTSLSRGRYKMGGHSVHLASRYDVSPRWSAGVGIGIDRYTKPNYNTMPVYATVRYKMLKEVPEVYAFADLGYAIKVGDYTQGCTGNIGVGYTHMFAKHFGLNFQVAYNLKRFTSIPTYIYNVESGDITFTEESSTRHSLSFGIGLTF